MTVKVSSVTFHTSVLAMHRDRGEVGEGVRTWSICSWPIAKMKAVCEKSTGGSRGNCDTT